jgi:hypothetical protein
MKHKSFFLFSLVFFIVNLVSAQDKENIAVRLADAQLKAYNARNIEDFLLPYSDTVKVYLFPNKLLYQGKAKMRESYEYMFSAYPELNCKVINRIIEGNIVIDQERVTLAKNAPLIEALAIYRVRNDKIVEVTFVYKDEKEK